MTKNKLSRQVTKNHKHLQVWNRVANNQWNITKELIQKIKVASTMLIRSLLRNQTKENHLIPRLSKFGVNNKNMN